MAETNINEFNRIGTPEGEVVFGDVAKNNAKMAVMIRRIFPNSKFTLGHSISLQMSGKLDGAILCEAPSLFGVYCGQKAVKAGDSKVAGIWYAENGDVIIGAPRGRLRIFAENIDIIASGDGDETGVVNLEGNSQVNINAATRVHIGGDDQVAIESDKLIDLNAGGSCKITAGDVHVIEGPDASPVTSPPGQNKGTLTLLDKIEAWKKMISSLVG